MYDVRAKREIDRVCDGVTLPMCDLPFADTQVSIPDGYMCATARHASILHTYWAAVPFFVVVPLKSDSYLNIYLLLDQTERVCGLRV